MNKPMNANDLRRPSRRRFLDAMGLGAGTLFLPSLVGDKQAYAAAAPKRLVLLWTTHGPGVSWRMRRAGLPDLTADWEFPFDDANPMSFSEALRPLHPNRDKIMVLDGIGFNSAFVDSPNGGNGHALSHNCIWNGSNAVQPTFDQYIAEQNAVAGRFKYLYYILGGTGGYSKSIDIAGKAVAAPELKGSSPSSLQAQVDRIFGAVTQPPTGTPGPLSPADLSRLRRPAVLGGVRAEYDALLPLLGAEDRAKLTRHRDMIADLDKQVAVLPQVKCEKPAGPGGAMTDTALGGFVMSKLIPSAMACDLTRVSMIEFGEPLSEEIGAPKGLDIHGDIAHQAAAGSANDKYMSNYYALRAKQFNDMVTAFRSVPEGNGTMLDNSILLWIPELSTGMHDLYRLMVVMAGGGGGSFKPGRYIKYAENGPQYDPYNRPADRVGPAHNQLLLSVMQAMGVNKTSIGTQSGKLWTGSSISLAGSLPRLSA